MPKSHNEKDKPEPIRNNEKPEMTISSISEVPNLFNKSDNIFEQSPRGKKNSFSLKDEYKVLFKKAPLSSKTLCLLEEVFIC